MHKPWVLVGIAAHGVWRLELLQLAMDSTRLGQIWVHMFDVLVISSSRHPLGPGSCLRRTSVISWLLLPFVKSLMQFGDPIARHRQLSLQVVVLCREDTDFLFEVLILMLLLLPSSMPLPSLRRRLLQQYSIVALEADDLLLTACQFSFQLLKMQSLTV